MATDKNDPPVGIDDDNGSTETTDANTVDEVVVDDVTNEEDNTDTGDDTSDGNVKDDDADDTEGDNKDSDDELTISRREAKKLRSESRGLRTVNKTLTAENETLKKELDELKTKVSDYELEKSEAEYNKMLADVKTEYGLNEKQAKYLRGDTLEELKKSAEEISEDFGVKSVDLTNLHNGDGSSISRGDLSNLTPEEIRALVRSKKLR